MKNLFIATFVANVVVTLITFVVLPEEVAIHFGEDGKADGWAPNYVNALLMTGVHLLIFFSFYYSPRLMFLFPAKWINLPNREYWLSPENKPRTVGKTEQFMWRFGVSTFLFFLVISLLTLQANLAEEVKLSLPVFFTVLGAYMLYTVWWTIAFFVAFRMPKEHRVEQEAKEGDG